MLTEWRSSLILTQYFKRKTFGPDKFVMQILKEEELKEILAKFDFYQNKPDLENHKESAYKDLIC